MKLMNCHHWISILQLSPSSNKLFCRKNQLHNILNVTVILATSLYLYLGLNDALYHYDITLTTSRKQLWHQLQLATVIVVDTLTSTKNKNQTYQCCTSFIQDKVLLGKIQHETEEILTFCFAEIYENILITPQLVAHSQDLDQKDLFWTS